MTFSIRKLIVVVLAVACLFGQAGCAAQPTLTGALILSETERAQLGTIGVVSARFVPKAEFETPAAGSLSGAGTVRARFKVDGELRVTEWGEQTVEVWPHIPTYFPFETPSE